MRVVKQKVDLRGRWFILCNGKLVALGTRPLTIRAHRPLVVTLYTTTIAFKGYLFKIRDHSAGGLNDIRLTCPLFAGLAPCACRAAALPGVGGRMLRPERLHIPRR